MNPSIKGLPARLVACCTASSAFTIAILTGLFVGNDVESTVSRALAAMVVCYVAGRLVGLAFEAVLHERIESELRGARSANPAPAATDVPGAIDQLPGQAPATRSRAA